MQGSLIGAEAAERNDAGLTDWGRSRGAKRIMVVEMVVVVVGRGARAPPACLRGAPLQCALRRDLSQVQVSPGSNSARHASKHA